MNYSDIVINTYFTDGYIGWGKLFIESFKYHHGTDHKLIITGRGLNKNQIKQLKQLYPLEVENKPLDLKKLAKRIKVDVDTLKRYKKQTERTKAKKHSKKWKLLIAAEDRVKSLRDLLRRLPEGANLLHLDADTYVNKRMDLLFNITKSNDFSTISRIEKQIGHRGKVFRESRAVLICVMGFTNNEITRQFVDKWIEYIVKIPPHKRPSGYGQISCYYAYNDFIKNKKFRFGQMKSYTCWPGVNRGSKTLQLKKYRKKFTLLKQSNK